LLMSDVSQNAWDWRFWVSMGWLAIPVSIGAVQLWLYLLKIDPVRSALWLYLCPIFGFLYAWFFLDEPLTGYTAVGTVLVLVALWWGRRG
jgi:probable blue pigment (indigoidine) exporter